MYRAKSKKSFIDKVHVTRHLSNLIAPEADMVIPEEPEHGRRYEVVVERQLLLSPMGVLPRKPRERAIFTIRKSLGGTRGSGCC
jgi:hypothetical protein